MASESSDSGFVDNWQGTKTLSECNLRMLTSEDSCDVSFRVGENEETVRCHRYILISRSCVFHAMLCGPLAEKDDIKIPDVCKDLFVEFLRFLYTDECCLTAENVAGLMYLSKKYAVGVLEKQCRSFLEESLSADNACTILEQAHLFDEKNLQEEAMEVILKECDTSLNTSGFRDLCRECFDTILRSDELTSHPKQAFTAVLAWAGEECRRQGKDAGSENQRLVLGESFYQIPFTFFDAKEFVRTVIPSKVLSEGEALRILSYCTCAETDVTPFRIQQQIYEVKIYGNTSPITVADVTLFRKKYIQDDIRVVLDRGMYLQGLVLQAGSGATYAISVQCQSKKLLSTKFTTKHSGCRLIFVNSIGLTKNTEYDVFVKHCDGNSPTILGGGLNETVEFGACTMTLERFNQYPYVRGLLSKLIIGTMPSRTEK